MASKKPSQRKLEASKAQSIAAQTGEGVERAKEMQSEADHADVRKHNQ
ncbi:hypothetical protein [Brevibacillus daliensis]|nr:hypothetical protein [Brevibacillus daliensis]